jgi:hypothetical protein
LQLGPRLEDCVATCLIDDLLQLVGEARHKREAGKRSFLKRIVVEFVVVEWQD